VRISEVADELAARLQSGFSLSRSMATFPDAFDLTTVSLVRLGEKTGALAHTLEEGQRRLERIVTARKRLKEALFYPVAVLVVTGVMLVFLIYYMLPRLLPVLTSFHVALPWPTRVLIGLDHHRWLVLGLFWLAVLALGAAVRSEHPELVRVREALARSLPGFGEFYQATLYTQICRDLALMLETGFAMLDAFDLIRRQFQQRWLRESLEATRRGIIRGDSLAEAFSGAGFPHLFVSTIKAGGESASLPKLLGSLAGLLEQRVEASRDRFLSLIEPMLVAGLGVVVGFVVLGCFLPIYSLISSPL
jgi:type II secretory pathway component PulF